MVFFGLFFLRFNGFVVCFVCVWGIDAKVLRCVFFFPVFWAFVWFRCFCGSCFCFLVFRFVLFVGLWFCFVAGLLLVLFLCCFFVFLFSFFLFSFFLFWFLEGLRVRWGGPKGHLTWPQTLLIFWFLGFAFCFFCFFCFSCVFLCFPFFAFSWKNVVPPKKGHFCY